MKKYLALIALAVLVCSCGNTVSPGDDILLSDGWALSSDSGTSCSAIVPSTVAGALYDAGYYQSDLFESDNYLTADPSIYDDCWTYTKNFTIRPTDATAYELVFDGLDFYADISFNGTKIASADTTFGVFIRRSYDVTDLVKPDNTVEVSLKKAVKGDLNIGFVDWNPRPIGESMGIVRPVHFHATGALRIEDVYVKPTLDTEAFATADLEVMVTLTNCSDAPVEGMLVLHLQDAEDCEVPVALEAGQTRELLLTPADASCLHVDNPRVWWSCDLGSPELYALDVECECGGAVSDRKDVTFGIRSIESYINADGHRQFVLNGKEILIKGAGWTDDIFLRDTPESIERQVLYVKDMNLNCIRFENIWGKDDTVYDLCDRMGLLAMVGWSCQWEWEDYCGIPEQGRFGCINTPELMDLAVAYFHDQVIRLHNHPSVFAWLTGSDGIPNSALDIRYHEIFDKYDYRPYVCSAKKLYSEVSGWSGTKMDGPYEYVGPEYWYLDTEEGGAFGFNTETCVGASFPQKESLERMIPQESLWPLSPVWDFHCTASSSAMGTTKQMQEVVNGYYGGFSDLDDFLMKAYAVDYNGTKAMFEAFRANVPQTTGIVQWMLNSAWPSLYWQLYDWYGVPTAGYYGVKRACEPLQLIFNWKDRKVYLVNGSADDAKVSVEARIFDASGALTAILSNDATAAVHHSEAVFDLSSYEGVPHFVSLSLACEDGRQARNFYAIPAADNHYTWGNSKWYILPIDKYADFSFTVAAEPAELSFSSSREGDVLSVSVSNSTDKVAAMVILKAKDADGNLIVPAYWSDNFFTLLPGESYDVSCTLPEGCKTVTVEIANN